MGFYYPHDRDRDERREREREDAADYWEKHAGWHPIEPDEVDADADEDIDIDHDLAEKIPVPETEEEARILAKWTEEYDEDYTESVRDNWEEDVVEEPAVAGSDEDDETTKNVMILHDPTEEGRWIESSKSYSRDEKR